MTAPAKRRPGRPSAAARKDRAEVVAAARQVFLTNGYAGTTLTMIAAAVDVTRPALHHYWPGGKAQAFAELSAADRAAAHRAAAQADARRWQIDAGRFGH